MLVRAWVCCGAVMFYAFACLSLSWFSTSRQMITAAVATAKADSESVSTGLCLATLSQRVADPEKFGSCSATSSEHRAARADWPTDKMVVGHLRDRACDSDGYTTPWTRPKMVLADDWARSEARRGDDW